MKIIFQSVELCGYLDEYFRDNPWQVVCDNSRHLLYVGFRYTKPDSFIVFDVLAHRHFDSLIGSEAFDLDVSRFLDSVRKEFPGA